MGLKIKRKTGQALRIVLPSGEEVKIVVEKSSKSVVSLDVDTTGELGVWREEIYANVPPSKRFRTFRPVPRQQETGEAASRNSSNS